MTHFGCDDIFSFFHKPDKDERDYNFTLLDRNAVNSIDTRLKKPTNEIDETKIRAYENAIYETYKKYKQTSGEYVAQEQIKEASKKFINERITNGFTRNNNARDELVRNVTPDDMIRIIAKIYIEQNISKEIESSLDASIYTTLAKYGEDHAIGALIEYLRTGKTGYFTNDNNSRTNLEQYMNRETAMNWVINKFAKYEVEKISKRQMEQNAKHESNFER